MEKNKRKSTKESRIRRNPDGSVRKRDIGTQRKCCACGIVKPESEFYFNDKEGKYQTRCVPCYKEYSRLYRLQVKNGERKPISRHDEEDKVVKPDTMSVGKLLSSIKVGDVLNVRRFHKEAKEAKIENIGKSSVTFRYENGVRESFNFADVIRIYEGKAIF